MAKTKVYIVSTTHWDREWYDTFQNYRFRLVRLIDELIDIMETDKDYKFYHFDGQTILIEDYLDIRPENADRLSKLIKDGRIMIGPWYTMPDEFLISGEGLVRNLNKGAEICEKYGVKSCPSGYVCDIFGHNSQMPQIFKGFDIDNASIFRGRKGHEADNFNWVGADGSTLILHKLHSDYAYSSFFFVARWQMEGKDASYKTMAERVKQYLDKQKQYFTGDFHLMMDGVDHIDPERKLPEMLEFLNQNIDGYEFIHSNFSDYTAAVRAKSDSLQKIEGAMYEVAETGVNNSLLKNVLSSMVHIKQDNDYCESGLTLCAEPLDFYIESNKKKLVKAASGSPLKGYINAAWKYVLQNQPHDSICGCSITPVHEDNVNRFRQAKEMIKLVKDDGMLTLANNFKANGKGKDGAFLIYNPSQEEVCGTREIEIELENYKHQRNFVFYDESGNVLPYNIISNTLKAKKNAQFKKLITFPGYDFMTVVLDVKVPAYGFTTITYDLLNSATGHGDYSWQYTEFNAPNRYLGSQFIDDNVIDNGKLIVSVNTNGTLKVTEKASGKVYDSMLLYEDCADVGEGWNYVKPIFDSAYNSRACSADVSIEADFPNLTKLRINTRMRLPKTTDGEKRSEEFEDFIINTFVTIYKNSTQLKIKTVVDNKLTHHRLRVSMPTNFKTETFSTLLPYDMYEFKIAKDDYSHTKEVDTLVNPNQGAVIMGDKQTKLALYNKGLYEVAVMDNPSRTLYLTLFRSFPHETSEPAAVMGKMIRKMTFEYAFDFDKDLTSNKAVKRANAFKQDFVVAPAAVSGDAKKLDSIVSITGEAIISALYSYKGGGIVRVYDCGNGASGKITFNQAVKKATEVKMNHEPVAIADFAGGAVNYTLRPRQIKTFFVEF